MRSAAPTPTMTADHVAPLFDKKPPMPRKSPSTRNGDSLAGDTLFGGGEGERLGVREFAVGERLGVGERDGDRLGVGERDGERERDGVRDGERVRDGVRPASQRCRPCSAARRRISDRIWPRRGSRERQLIVCISERYMTRCA
jgi:hypothetical protein